MKTVTLLVAHLAVLLIDGPRLRAAEPVQLKVNAGGFKRHAIVFAPQNRTEKAPVILAFHGHGGNMNAFAHAAGFQNAWPGAIVVYPQGLPIKTAIDPGGLKPGWQRQPGEVGNRDLKFVDALLGKLREKYSIDDQHIFVAGFSNGAFFTYLLWAKRPQTFTGFAPVAGRSDLSGNLTVPKPAVQIGGRADRLVRLADLEKAMTNVRRLDGCAEQGEPCGPGCTRYASSKNAPVINWIHPGPHIYPPRATLLIINFFKELTRK